ncbi:MAG: acyl-CoA dehydrogenase family protein [Actinomycetota bacterium]
MSSPRTTTYPADPEVLRDRLFRAVEVATPILESQAEVAEQNSQLTSKAIDALREAGLFRLGVPRRFDGYDADITTAFEVITRIGRGCPSSAWILMVTYVTQIAATSYGDLAQHDLWSAGPDVPMCGAFRPDRATVRTADDGIWVTGRWSWASGCHHAAWAWLGVPAEEERLAPGLVLIPLTDLRIESTWNMAGMRGTGSDTVVADEVFVPAHRMQRTGVAAEPESGAPRRVVPLNSLSTTMIAPLLGATQDVLRRTLSLVEGGKPLAMSFHPRSADAPSTQRALADAANLIDSAELHVLRSTRFVDAAVAEGIEQNLVGRGRVRMDMAHASTCLRDAMALLLTVAGASAFRADNVIQRHWRDLETGARHPLLNTGLQRESYGRALVGDERPVSPML